MVDRQPEPAPPVCLLLFFPPADLENNGVNGICIANVDQQGNILSTVHDVRVTGFTVQGFPGASPAAGGSAGAAVAARSNVKPAARLSAQFPRPLTYSPADADESSAYAHRPYQPLGLRAICQPHSEVMTT